eukprot:jgi/Phyca11/19965/fgenesh1_pg.PHYCAscaffold_54_\
MDSPDTSDATELSSRGDDGAEFNATGAEPDGTTGDPGGNGDDGGDGRGGDGGGEDDESDSDGGGDDGGDDSDGGGDDGGDGSGGSDGGDGEAGCAAACGRFADVSDDGPAKETRASRDFVARSPAVDWSSTKRGRGEADGREEAMVTDSGCNPLKSSEARPVGEDGTGILSVRSSEREVGKAKHSYTRSLLVQTTNGR